MENWKRFLADCKMIFNVDKVKPISLQEILNSIHPANNLKWTLVKLTYHFLVLRFTKMKTKLGWIFTQNQLIRSGMFLLTLTSQKLILKPHPLV